uniref:Uncharacterized protein n=1 Tax=Tetranychus urticae TaxID=32264 RepID=T1KPR3_TETUR
MFIILFSNQLMCSLCIAMGLRVTTH